MKRSKEWVSVGFPKMCKDFKIHGTKGYRKGFYDFDNKKYLVDFKIIADIWMGNYL